MKRFFSLILLIVVSLFSFNVISQNVEANQLDYASLDVLIPNGKRQLVLGDFDSLGRATFAHIQLQDKDEPIKQREPQINFDPKGWHNYKMSYGTEGKKDFLFHRGHLIGYQFSGLTNEGRNLVQLTAWTNIGNYSGVDDTNPEGMFYYEKRLDNWLAIHPNFWLDYKVTPIYTGDELVPRQIILRYVGVDENGNLLPINFSSDKEITDEYGITTVTLENYSKNANIDYLTGMAEPSLVPTETLEQEDTKELEDANLAKVVYIARQGKADVYWYSKDNMPANTNFSRVIEMSEADALSIGKRHTSKE
ncbi:DNA/RNA non-specific endonuclease [Tuanshanicoccus lijuaniae]|uniref:DNA/RNA non-specific endonuclease n=1 Tax=Aerococcaceae bacterium zg-1292 TaxID=2774330 RepID=UPI0019374E26|nr:DNA/RNA non-specific endonuclease [Aerococcaceae bacterium zg-1292]QQA36314.1 DNA/RNA non-specific endonuclease [Aerococcaceae bacterium zg-1292]